MRVFLFIVIEKKTSRNKTITLLNQLGLVKRARREREKDE